MSQQNNMGFQAAENDYVMTAQANNPAALVEETKKHRALYPEIHYKLKPFISVTCDAIQASGAMPNQEELENISDNIYDEFIGMHPEMEQYMKTENRADDPPEAVQTISFGGFRRGYGGFRGRGIGRDLIGALLLSELFGRRYPYYPNYYPYQNYHPYY